MKNLIKVELPQKFIDYVAKAEKTDNTINEIVVNSIVSNNNVTFISFVYNAYRKENGEWVWNDFYIAMVTPDDLSIYRYTQAETEDPHELENF